MNPFYLLGFQQAKRNILSTQEKDIYIWNTVIMPYFQLHMGTLRLEREDTQNIYII